MNNDKLIVSYKDRIIDDRYKIIETVGVGGMAVVFKAQDMLMNRYVALKLLNEELSTNEKAIRRFANESKAVAMISSEHIVKIYDVNLDHRPQYIAMEYVSGITLKEYMDAHAPLPWDQAVTMITQLLSALRHTHEKGIIHRDVKPQNVMVTEDLRLKLTDFGIAKLPGSEPLEEDEKAMGTVYYISPEQASGKPVDFYTDIYSVGVIFYEMLTGKLPFTGDTPLSVAMMHINNQPLSPRKYNDQIPAALEQIILKAMAKNPADRFRTAASMNRALKLYIKDNGIIFEKETLDSIDETSLEPKKETKIVKRKRIRQKTKHGRRTMFPIIFGVSCAFLMVFLAAGAILAVSLLNMTKDRSVTLVVPNLCGEEYSEEYAKSLETDNVKITAIEYVYTKDYPSGVIVEQKPEAGARKKLADNTRFCEITLKVSRGNENVVIPDLAITEYRSAIIALENEELRYKVVQTFSSTILDGYVISTEPAAGSLVPKNSEVTIYVSQGQEVGYTSMPDLTGKTRSQVKSILADRNLILGKITREPSNSPTGTVIAQSVAAGKSVPKKYTVVDITLSVKIPDHPVPPPTTIVPTAPPTTVAPSTTVKPTTQTPVNPSTSPAATKPPASTQPPASTKPPATATPSTPAATQTTPAPTTSTAPASTAPSASAGTTPTPTQSAGASQTPPQNGSLPSGDSHSSSAEVPSVDGPSAE